MLCMVSARKSHSRGGTTSAGSVDPDRKKSTRRVYVIRNSSHTDLVIASFITVDEEHEDKSSSNISLRRIAS